MAFASGVPAQTDGLIARRDSLTAEAPADAAVTVSAAPCQANPQSREFDFWVGEWDVVSLQGQALGSNRVVADLRGCILVEHWTNVGGREGRSINVVDATHDPPTWRQFYVGDAGGVTDYASGSLRDGVMEFRATVPGPDGGPTVRRMRFRPVHADTVHQIIEDERGPGDWVQRFYGVYVRRPSREPSPIQEDSVPSTLYDDHEATDDHPWGRIHDAAHPRTGEFDFLVGAFDCADERLEADGVWTRSPALWTARYILNGHAIQDTYWNDRYAGTSLRYVDPVRDTWIVRFLGMPDRDTGEWIGGVRADGRMVLTRPSRDADGAPTLSRLTFEDIGPEGFTWKSESVRAGVASARWRISCVRRDGS